MAFSPRKYQLFDKVLLGALMVTFALSAGCKPFDKSPEEIKRGVGRNLEPASTCSTFLDQSSNENFRPSRDAKDCGSFTPYHLQNDKKFMAFFGNSSKIFFEKMAELEKEKDEPLYEEIENFTKSARQQIPKDETHRKYHAFIDILDAEAISNNGGKPSLQAIYLEEAARNLFSSAPDHCAVKYVNRRIADLTKRPKKSYVPTLGIATDQSARPITPTIDPIKETPAIVPDGSVEKFQRKFLSIKEDYEPPLSERERTLKEQGRKDEEMENSGEAEDAEIWSRVAAKEKTKKERIEKYVGWRTKYRGRKKRRSSAFTLMRETISMRKALDPSSTIEDLDAAYKKLRDAQAAIAALEETDIDDFLRRKTIAFQDENKNFQAKLLDLERELTTGSRKAEFEKRLRYRVTKLQNLETTSNPIYTAGHLNYGYYLLQEWENIHTNLDMLDPNLISQFKVQMKRFNWNPEE